MRMHILVVDGFSANSDGRKRFQDFYAMVAQGFERHLQFAHGINIHVKRYDDVAEFVPASVGELIRVAPIKNFDKLDFVFVDGDLPLRPWTRAAQPLYKLLSMSVQTGKCMWASSFAAGLVLCAIQAPVDMRDVIPALLHAFPEGGSLDELRRLPPPKGAARKPHRSASGTEAAGEEERETSCTDELEALFLDAETGDCYQPDLATGTYHGYRFAFNCGVKRRRLHPDAARQLNRFSFPTARVVPVDAALIAPAPYELRTSVVRQHMKHWLFKGLDCTQPLLLRSPSYKWYLSAKPTRYSLYLLY